MRLWLDADKSLEENAESFFVRSKKAKKKSRGAASAVERISSSEIKKKERKTTSSVKRKKEHWYMKYRWFFIDDNTLIIGGRDANTNEEIIKRRTEPYDIVFHAEMPGSPFFVIKGSKGRLFTEDEKQFVANATASYSRAWKYGVSFIDIFCVAPTQVSKKARAGEYLSKGSFMIRGNKEFYKGILLLYGSIITLDSSSYIMITPQERDDSFVRIIPGSMKPSDAAKSILSNLDNKTDINADEIILSLPAGNVELEFLKKRGESS
ncbi:MAG: NFACT RNA binding domain-containing protein [Candidatus Woesearchaeota archaeon]